MFRDVAKAFRTLRKRFAMSRRPSELFGNVSRRREGLPNSSETFRDIAKAFRTLWKRFATSRRPSELFGNVPRRREGLPNSSETLPYLTPSALRASPPRCRGRKIATDTIPLPLSRGGAPRRGEGVTNGPERAGKKISPPNPTEYERNILTSRTLINGS